jgi:hypothetical protein
VCERISWQEILSHTEQEKVVSREEKKAADALANEPTRFGGGTSPAVYSQLSTF